MKKTISINLGGRNFYIEEDAFLKLDTYLNSVKTHFAGYPDHDEIVADMESRMAEKFSERKTTDAVITLKEIEELVTAMGQVEDFGDGGKTGQADASTAPQQPTRAKKLYRNPDDVIIAGVCSGLAAYFGIDTVLVRLLFAVSVLFGGFGVVFYIILWIVMPVAKTASEKIQMEGEAITLASLEQKAKETAQEIKKNGSVQKIAKAPVIFFRKLVNALFIVLRALISLLLKIIGLSVVIGAVAGIIGLLFLLLTLVFNINSPYVELPLRDMIFDWRYYVLAFASFFAAIIPLIGLMVAGISLLTFKNSINKVFSFSLLALWVIALAGGGAMALRLVPEIQAKIEQDPQYKTASKSFDYKDFSKLQAGGALRVTIVQASTTSVTATGRQADLDRLEFRQNEGELAVEQGSNKKICIFCWHSPVSLTIQMPKIDAVSLSGVSRLQSEKIIAQNFDLKLSGASRAYLTINAVNFTANLSGASRSEIGGTTTQASIKLSDASRYYGEEAKAGILAAELSGASQAYVNATTTLTVKASGASKVYYSGSPQITSSLSGSSRIIEQGIFVPRAPEPPQLEEQELIIK